MKMYVLSHSELKGRGKQTQNAALFFCGDVCYRACLNSDITPLVQLWCDGSSAFSIAGESKRVFFALDPAGDAEAQCDPLVISNTLTTSLQFQHLTLVRFQSTRAWRGLTSLHVRVSQS